MTQGNPAAYNLYVRIDKNNSPIDSTNKLYKNAPRQGRWLKLDTTGNVCCDVTNLTFAYPGSVGTPVLLNIQSSGTTFVTVSIPGTPTTIDALVLLLNQNAGYLGNFYIDGTNVKLNLLNTVAGTFALNTLSMVITD